MFVERLVVAAARGGKANFKFGAVERGDVGYELSDLGSADSKFESSRSDQRQEILNELHVR